MHIRVFFPVIFIKMSVYICIYTSFVQDFTNTKHEANNIIPILRWGKWDRERSNDLLEILQLVNSGVAIWTQAVWLSLMILLHWSMPVLLYYMSMSIDKLSKFVRSMSKIGRFRVFQSITMSIANLTDSYRGGSSSVSLIIISLLI